MTTITPHLLIGGQDAAENFNLLQNRGVKLVVNATREIPNYFPRSFEYVKLDLDDTQSQSLAHLLPTINLIINTIRQGKVVFVHCAAGISRSSSIVVLTLMRMNDWSFQHSLSFLKSMYNIAEPNPGFVKQLTSMGNTQPQRGRSVVVVNEDYDMIPTDGQSAPQPSRQAAPRQAPHQQAPPQQAPPPTGGGADGRGWCKLTLDGEECELPQYAPAGGRGVYARIFR
jgi:predicted protein tyrosine phosphatase